MHGHDLSPIIARIKHSGKQRVAYVRSLKKNLVAFALLKLHKHHQQEILDALTIDEIEHLLHFLDPDEATHLLHSVSAHRRNAIVSRLTKELREKVEFLLKFSPESAAGIMNVDYIEVPKTIGRIKLAALIKEHIDRTGRPPTVLAVENGILLGEFPIHKLLQKRTGHIEDALLPLPNIHYNEAQEEVIRMFRKNRNRKVAVLDDDQSILGVIHANDVIRTLDRQSTKELYEIAGVKTIEHVFGSAWEKVKYRYAWLIINLFTAFLAAWVVSLFQNTINAYVLLAAYMPVVAGMGGNAATQTLVVITRGIALKEIELKNAWPALVNEVTGGVMNGLIIGVIVAIAATVFNSDPILGVVVALAVLINFIVAGVFGTLIPLYLKSRGIDPASSATVFITTATDCIGFLAFLGLASLILV